MYWLEISVKTDGEAAESVSEILQPFAYGGSVVLEQFGDSSSSDPFALELAVSVKIYISGDEDSPILRRRIEEALYHMSRLYPIPAPKFRKLEDEDWATAWRENFHPFRVGRRLFIQPTWNQVGTVGEEDILITMDPGMAFGTGLHPSTQMCLQFLEELVYPGQRMLDVGTGSGILAIAAAKLGAEKIVALDTDKMSVKVAQENAALNDTLDQTAIYQGTLASIGRFEWDMVIVNILAPTIISLISDHDLFAFVRKEGRLILSGIIEEQLSDVRGVIREAGGEIESIKTIRDWVALAVQKV